MALSKYHISIPDATKDGEVVKFTIQTKINETEETEGGKVVLRQYEDFEYLLHCLTTRNPSVAIVIPPLPPKPIVIPAGSESKFKIKPDVSRAKRGDEYYQDCKRLERFLRDVVCQPVFEADDLLSSFLTEEQPPVRAAVKKGLINVLMTAVDTARFHHHKDVSDDFQKRRDNTDMMLLQMKQCFSGYGKSINADNDCAAQHGNLAMALRNSATVDIQNSKILARFFGQFSDVLDDLVSKLYNQTHISDDSLGFSLELYSRNLLACQEMLFRRTCKMVELENATKALEKAKPKNRDQLLSAKEDADRVFEEVSENAAAEYESFTKRRIQHFRDSLTDLAERQIKNHSETCDLLRKTIDELRSVQAIA